MFHTLQVLCYLYDRHLYNMVGIFSLKTRSVIQVDISTFPGWSTVVCKSWISSCSLKLIGFRDLTQCFRVYAGPESHFSYKYDRHGNDLLQNRSWLHGFNHKHNKVVSCVFGWQAIGPCAVTIIKITLTQKMFHLWGTVWVEITEKMQFKRKLNQCIYHKTIEIHEVDKKYFLCDCWQDWEMRKQI